MAHDLEKVDGTENSPSTQVASEPNRKLRGIKWFLFNVSTLTAIFLYALDNTVVANIQPVNSMQSTNSHGYRSDAKILFILFALNFMAASALCGGAPNMPAEIIGRVWAGAGGNGMYYGLLNLVSTNTLDRECPTYLSLTGMIWGVGTVLGPVIGGAFELYTWRWAFYINLLFGAVVIPAYFYLIPSNNPAPGISLRDKIITFDWLGAILSTGGFVKLIVATNFGGDMYAWNSGTIIGLFVVSGVLWLLLILQQSLEILTTVENRMFPVHLLRNKEAVLLSLLASCGGSIAYVTVYYIPLYYQFTRGDSAIRTAERILPLIFLLIFGMLSNGYVMSKLGWYKPWYVCGAAISLVGAVLMSRLKLESSNSEIYGYQVLIGLGARSFAHAGFAVIQTVVNIKDTVNGVTLIMLGQLCGLAFSLSVTGALFINLARNNLQHVFPNVDKSTLASIVSGTSGGFLETQSDSKKSQALEAIVSALQDVFTEVYVVAALACILSVFLKWRKVYMEGAAGGM
ncbi:MFS general substrate transporter [Penicillium macrosclerotiorum]|uniref:MFS general substrate transporter n=1 Tax=Penicillium macrosclerotiorum TaxID=303699 RepID=UPI002547A89D|nr:MFS general substrate transporter [Penicillium macrosclerotiorum]KAJ5689705.1 MFS general substrate transporter [Penicillium macrosclerotiorum]